MKLKKAGALGLSCVIALGSMAGCGSSKEKEKTDGKEEISGEIRYAFWDMHIPQELRIRSRGTERHSASN